MPLRKITDKGKGPSKVKETKFKQEKLLEKKLENAILTGAKEKIEKFNRNGLHYNLAEIENMEDGSIRLVARARR